MGPARRAIEVKSGQTVVTSMLRPLHALAPALEEPDHPVTRWLVYGGDERRRLQGVELLPWRQIASTDWTRAAGA